MGIMDDMKDMGGMRDRLQELEQRAKDDNLDDKGREELAKLREHFSSHNSDDTMQPS